MKYEYEPAMKIALLALLTFTTTLSFGQEKSLSNSYQPETPPAPRAETEMETSAILHKEIAGQSFVYTFESNTLISQEKADRWEPRFYQTFPSLEEIVIDVYNQEVTLRLPNSHTQSELLGMVKRFGYTTFEITN